MAEWGDECRALQIWRWSGSAVICEKASVSSLPSLSADLTLIRPIHRIASAGERASERDARLDGENRTAETEADRHCKTRIKNTKEQERRRDRGWSMECEDCEVQCKCAVTFEL